MTVVRSDETLTLKPPFGTNIESSFQTLLVTRVRLTSRRKRKYRRRIPRDTSKSVFVFSGDVQWRPVNRSDGRVGFEMSSHYKKGSYYVRSQ